MEIIKPKKWMTIELRDAGFRYYERKRQLVMARVLPEAEAPLTIQLDREQVSVPAGYVICYEPGNILHKRLKDYNHWPNEPAVFDLSYSPWPQMNWTPSTTERDLMRYGCRPYYKSVGVWARRLTKPTYVQSIESPQPVLVPRGMWLAIDASGGPYYMKERLFKARYELTHAATQ